MKSARDGQTIVLRLEDGEDLFGVLGARARTEGIRAGTVRFGIGMFGSATLGYWDGSQYRPHDITAPHELVALHGTLAWADEQPSIHLHAALAGPDHRLVGGHLLRATVKFLNEIEVQTFPGREFGRPMVESFGLRMLDLEPSPGR